MSDKYILSDNGEPINEPDLLKWARWFESADRHVRNDTIGESTISTVFLGLDHSFGNGEPVLWQTMVFGGALDGECDRCSGTKQDAMAMHAKMVSLVKQQ